MAEKIIKISTYHMADDSSISLVIQLVLAARGIRLLISRAYWSPQYNASCRERQLGQIVCANR